MEQLSMKVLKALQERPFVPHWFGDFKNISYLLWVIEKISTYECGKQCVKIWQKNST